MEIGRFFGLASVSVVFIESSSDDSLWSFESSEYSTAVTPSFVHTASTTPHPNPSPQTLTQVLSLSL